MNFRTVPFSEMMRCENSLIKIEYTNLSVVFLNRQWPHNILFVRLNSTNVLGTGKNIFVAKINR